MDLQTSIFFVPEGSPDAIHLLSTESAAIEKLLLQQDAYVQGHVQSAATAMSSNGAHTASRQPVSADPGHLVASSVQLPLGVRLRVLQLSIPAVADGRFDTLLGE